MSDRQARRHDIACAVHDLKGTIERLADYQRSDPEVVRTELPDLIAAAMGLHMLINWIRQ